MGAPSEYYLGGLIEPPGYGPVYMYTPVHVHVNLLVCVMCVMCVYACIYVESGELSRSVHCRSFDLSASEEIILEKCTTTC